MRILEFALILALLALLSIVTRDDLGQRSARAGSDAKAANLEKAQSASVAAANQRQADCDKDFAGALSAGVAIAKASAVRPRTDPKVQPMISAAQIEAILQ
jgi:hypothetical protein